VRILDCMINKCQSGKTSQEICSRRRLFRAFSSFNDPTPQSNQGRILHGMKCDPDVLLGRFWGLELDVFCFFRLQISFYNFLGTFILLDSICWRWRVGQVGRNLDDVLLVIGTSGKSFIKVLGSSTINGTESGIRFICGKTGGRRR
jgi:hypothetical protein